MKEFILNKWLYYLGGFIILSIILFEAQGKGDFNIFISASRDLLAGKNIYKVQYNYYYHYYYDIIFALILIPFTFIPLYITKVFWLILNVFFVYRIWIILINWLPISNLNKKNKTIFTILSFIFIFNLLHVNFHLSQVTIFILYLTLEGLFLINNKKIITGCLLIALGINIKLLPIIIIPYLIYRNEWKSAFYIIVFIIAFLTLPALFIGFDYNKSLIIERWHLLNPMNTEHILDTSERSFHSLTTLLATLLVKNCSNDPYALTLKRNIADISIENLNIIINIIRGILILFTLYFLRTIPFKNTTIKIQKLYEISYISLIIPLIFPHQQHYAFFFIFPATTYLIFYLVYLFFTKENYNIIKNFKTKKISIIITLCIIYFLTNSHFILGEFIKYYNHYKTLTYGVLILMILLAFCKPEILYKNKVISQNNVDVKS
ncbi:MAG: glycosyltransferase 87 family protein [Bacteroidota bacterium]|nr:glycosyltransferase 87 family protein [Bacteroidota bacterium]